MLGKYKILLGLICVLPDARLVACRLPMSYGQVVEVIIASHLVQLDGYLFSRVNTFRTTNKQIGT